MPIKASLAGFDSIGGGKCDALYAVEGLVVPREPTDPDDVTGARQEYRGSVVVGILNFLASACS